MENPTPAAASGQIVLQMVAKECPGSAKRRPPAITIDTAKRSVHLRNVSEVTSALAWFIPKRASEALIQFDDLRAVLLYPVRYHYGLLACTLQSTTQIFHFVLRQDWRPYFDELAAIAQANPRLPLRKRAGFQLVMIGVYLVVGTLGLLALVILITTLSKSPPPAAP